MKKITFLFSLSIVVLLVILYVLVQLTEGGLSVTKSPEEAYKDTILIRTVKPNIREFSYNESTNLIIDKSWVEKYRIKRKRLFWVERTVDQNSYLIKISYSFKDKMTGRVFNDFKNDLLIEKVNGLDNNFTLSWENGIYAIVKGKPDQEIVLTLSLPANHREVIKFN